MNRRPLARAVVRRPVLWAVATWLASAAAGIAAVVLADFGAPAWVFLALGAWLLTAGLPTLVASLVVLAGWAGLPPRLMPPPVAGAVALVAATFLAQLGATALLARLVRRRGRL